MRKNSAEEGIPVKVILLTLSGQPANTQIYAVILCECIENPLSGIISGEASEVCSCVGGDG